MRPSSGCRKTGECRPRAPPPARIGNALSPSGCAGCARPARCGSAPPCTGLQALPPGLPARPGGVHPAGLHKAGASRRGRGAGPEPHGRPLPPRPGWPGGAEPHTCPSSALGLPRLQPCPTLPLTALQPRSNKLRVCPRSPRIPFAFPLPSPSSY